MTNMAPAPAASPMRVEPVVLEGRNVRLEPLTMAHLDALVAVGLDPTLWQYTLTRNLTPDDMRRYVESALAERHAGHALPFATVERRSGVVVGSTRFGAIEPSHRRVEIGWTWIAPAWQRTVMNTEAKYLMLGHAFDVWGCQRVELKTSSTNERSQRAIARIGGTKEGVFRKHMINADGTPRDSVYYSIIDDDWPAIRARLEAMMAAYG